MKAPLRRLPIIQRQRTTASPRTQDRRIGRPLLRLRGVLLRGIKQRNLQHHSKHRMGVPTPRQAEIQAMARTMTMLPKLQLPRRSPSLRRNRR